MERDAGRLLDRLTRICVALAQAKRERMGRHARFSVGQKTFAYFLDDHHGDGMIALNCKAVRGLAQALVASDPARFHVPAYLGSKGWIGVRLDVGKVRWNEIADLITESYRLVAPKRLAASIGKNNAG